MHTQISQAVARRCWSLLAKSIINIVDSIEPPPLLIHPTTTKESSACREGTGRRRPGPRGECRSPLCPNGFPIYHDRPEEEQKNSNHRCSLVVAQEEKVSRPYHVSLSLNDSLQCYVVVVIILPTYLYNLSLTNWKKLFRCSKIAATYTPRLGPLLN